MFSRNPRRGRRVDRRAISFSTETLEVRQLMAYSAFGYSLPQLSVTGYGPSQAAWGNTIAVDVDVQNTGASSLIEPTALYPGALSSADAVNTTVNIYAATRPNATTNLVQVGSITIPAIRQNSDVEQVAIFNLPARPDGFPPAGKIYLTLVVNNNQSILQTSTAGNVYRVPNPVQIVANPLPNLQVTGLDIAQPLQPGDVITPTIQVTNFGVANPNLQGPVTVALIASVDKKFGPGDVIVGTYTIDSLPGVAGVPTQTGLNYSNNLYPTPNVLTTTLPAIKLPTTPRVYYLGVKIDPAHTINETYGPNNKLDDVVRVGPPVRNLNPATVLIPTTTSVTFPFLPVTIVNSASATTPLISTTGPVSTVSAASVSARAVKARAHPHHVR